MLLKSYPVLVIPIPIGVVLKRGSSEFQVQGKDAHEIVNKVLRHTDSKARTLEEICSIFPPELGDGIKALINILIQKRILYPASAQENNDEESPLDVFYWNYNTSHAKVSSSFSGKKLSILGINSISLQFAQILKDMEFINYRLVDFPELNNLNLSINPSFPLVSYEKWHKEFDATESNCIIPISDFGGLSILREFNVFCFKNKSDLFPIVLQDNIGLIGPFIVPDSTSCFECFLSRRNSNLDHPNLNTLIENEAVNGKKVAGYHPAMAASIAGFAFLQLEKMYGGWMLPDIANTIIEINLLDCRLIQRKVLKIPYCSVCSPTRFTPSISLEKEALVV